MTTSDKAGDPADEASMDDILASIRKIIADDPSAPRAGRDARASNPLLEPSAPLALAPRDFGTGGPLLPPAERFGDVLRSATDAIRAGIDSQRPAPSVRNRAFADQSLDGLFDDGQSAPAPTVSTAEPAPQAGVPSRDPWSAWRNLRPDKEAAAVPAQAEVTTPAPSETATDVPPVAPEPARPIASTASNTPATGQPSAEPVAAKKTGFYPPSSATPVTRRQNASFTSAFPKSSFAAPSADATSPSGQSGASNSGTSSGPSGSAPSAALNGASMARADETPRERNASALNGSALPPAAEPLAAAIEETAAAVSQALEKLNAGLAEIPASAPVPPPSTTVAAAPSAAAVPLAAAAVAAPLPARTLDDMVSDMLRPMLEKWVEANMPRLMEKALRPVPSKEDAPPRT